MPIRLFDLLGLAPPPDRSESSLAARATAAALLFRLDRVRSSAGVSPGGDATRPELAALLRYWDDISVFQNLRPGADGTRFGLVADLTIEASRPAGVHAAVFVQLPDVRFSPLSTAPGHPAHVFFTAGAGGDGLELVIDSLPVRIELPVGWVDPPETAGGRVVYPGSDPTIPGSDPGVSFRAEVADDLVVRLDTAFGGAQIDVHIKLRMTAQGDFIIEPAVPISIGPCKFRGVNCKGLFDINFVPSPVLRGHHGSEQALEWTRHDLRPAFDVPSRGVVTIRTVDLAPDSGPLRDLLDRLNRGRTTGGAAEIVIEDIALPTGLNPFLPPPHGRLAIRQNIATRDGDPYDFHGAHFTIPLGPLRFDLFKLLVQSVARFEDGPIQIVGKLVFGDDPERAPALELHVDEEWTLQLGYRWPTGRTTPGGSGGTSASGSGSGPPTSPGGTTPTTPAPPSTGLRLMTIGPNEVKVTGFKAGFSFGRLASQDPRYQWFEMVQLLVDIRFGAPDVPIEERETWLTRLIRAVSRIVRIENISGRPLDVTFRELGWSLGNFVGPSASSFPDGMQIVIVDLVKLIISEVAWVTETNGGQYFSLSGGLEIIQGPPRPAGATDEDRRSNAERTRNYRDSKEPGFRLDISRLRFRIAGNENAPPWALDGISLDFRGRTWRISGFFMIREYDLPAPANPSLQDHYKEYGGGLTVACTLAGKQWELGIQVFYGSATGTRDFWYLLIGLQLDLVPVGTCQLTHIAGLFAYNMAPRLPASTGLGAQMRQLQWYRDHGGRNCIIIRESRALDGWERKPNCFSIGLGFGVEPPGGAICKVDAFAFFHYAPDDTGLLIVVEIYMLKSRQPIGYGAIDIDFTTGAWGVQIGVDLDLLALVGADDLPEWMRFFRLTGTLYFGNPPATFALGRIRDPATWLTLRLAFQAFLRFELTFAICVEIVPATGPMAGGLMITFRATGDFGFARFVAFATLGLIIGVWHNDSSAVGVLFWLEASLRVTILWFFELGISARVEIDVLCSSPGYRKLGAELHIHIGGIFPDVNARFEHVWDDPHPEQLKVFSAPLERIEAFRAQAGNVDSSAGPRSAEPASSGAAETTPSFALSGLDGAAAFDASAVRSLEEIQTLAAAPRLPEESPVALALVGTDSTIALGFKPSVGDETASGDLPPADAGVQEHDDLRIAYRLVSLSIERRPRFGGDRTWRPLLSPNESSLEGRRAGSVTQAPSVSWRWDLDVRKGEALDPRRLLLNAETPFSFVTGNPEADEAIAHAHGDEPCCAAGAGAGAPGAGWHALDFAAVSDGTRAPATQRFRDSSSAARWWGAPPLVVLGAGDEHLGRMLVTESGQLAALDFAEEVDALALELGRPFANDQIGKGALVVRLWAGLEPAGPPLRFDLLELKAGVPLELAAAGVTSADLELDLSASPGTGFLDIRALSYHAAPATRAAALRADHCALARATAAGVAGHGALAWLPNHQYRVDVTVEASIRHERTGELTSRMTQRAFFATKGPLGLNAVARVGDELEPYVESRYPGRTPLYRCEPLALAFTEQFNRFVFPDPFGPAERTQALELELAVERVGGEDGRTTVTQTSNDWLDTHRRAGAGLGARDRTRGRRRRERIATSYDPRQRRLADLFATRADCGDAPARPSASRVYLHDPVAGAALWDASAGYLATLRPAGGAVIERDAFQAGDETALQTPPDDGSWRVVDGRLVAPRTEVTARAVFGERDWTHLQVRVGLVCTSGRAGVAVGEGEPAAPFEVLLDASDAAHPVLLCRRAGVELGRQPVGGASEPYALEVTAFDDVVRASVGDARIEVPRAEVRRGCWALLSEQGASFASLHVHALDAYHFPFATSRYASFAEHVGSFQRATPRVDLEDTVPWSALFVDRTLDIAAVMSAGADPEARQRVFDRFAQALALPLRTRLDRVEITPCALSRRTALLLLESPEPLSFSEDVRLRAARRVGAVRKPWDAVVLTNGDETRALIFRPGGRAIAAGEHELTLAIARARYRSEGADPDAIYQAEHTLTLAL